jgi:hypothetical protein
MEALYLVCGARRPQLKRDPLGGLDTVTWEPITLTELESLLSRDLAACSESQRDFFARVRVQPVKWRLSPWGDEGGGFWAVAVHGDRVLWYNDIEGGFNVSNFKVRDQIPEDQYWCNQDPLQWALPRLENDHGWRSGPPAGLNGA